MAKIKIISDPYERKITYRQYNATKGEWESIDNDNSKLHSEKLTHSVFPFVVKKSADAIVNEFSSGEDPITIVFEGTDDEYKELVDVCSCEEYNGRLIPELSVRRLNNARDILPEVKQIFDQMEPLINASVKDNKQIEHEKKQFADVSKEAIPICVFGNYSSGKSTFINSLIGYEILPSGDDPLTAKIHRIERSAYDDRATVGFEYAGKRIEILFDKSGSPSINMRIDDEFFNRFNAAMSEVVDAPMVHRVYKALEVINDAENESVASEISDIIDVRIPFNPKGILSSTLHQFVIFDTPGANSASNAKHFNVLRQAMENLSNGLPIFVSEYDELDTKDSKSLCDTIKTMYRLDRRYTIVVVNKADQINFGRKPMDTGRVLNHTTPRNLDVERIFFVSSLMGLGSKNNGEFINEYYDEIFSDLENKFSDPESKYYKRLYIYDIMPDHLKKRSVELSEEEPNKIYANSGLFWIEKEMDTFAGKYSAYNKCQQSKLFLDAVIEKTTAAIEDEKKRNEEDKADFESKLDSGQQALVEKLDGGCNDLQQQLIKEYAEQMKPEIDQAVITLEKEALVKHEEELTEKRKSEHEQLAASEAETVQQEPAPEEKKSKLAGLFGGMKESLEKAREQREAEKTIDSEIADQILSEVKEQFTENTVAAQAQLNEASKNYWLERSELMKKKLIDIVTGSDELSDEKRSEIEEIIMTYAPISFERHADDIFSRADFEHKSINLFGFKLFENNRLNLGKLAKVFNSEHKKAVTEIAANISESHERSFKEWNADLLMEIKENITEFNPELQKLVRYIAEKESHILELEDRRSRLNNYINSITQLMSWHERK
ncbi:MAG TPA: dynamin family protein [Ruminococcus sp.]|nr:dynamin family protein [Ruminococcus sp.]